MNILYASLVLVLHDLGLGPAIAIVNLILHRANLLDHSSCSRSCSYQSQLQYKFPDLFLALARTLVPLTLALAIALDLLLLLPLIMPLLMLIVIAIVITIVIPLLCCYIAMVSHCFSFALLCYCIAISIAFAFVFVLPFQECFVSNFICNKVLFRDPVVSVGISVSDMGKSLAYWRDLLGMKSNKVR